MKPLPSRSIARRDVPTNFAVCALFAVACCLGCDPANPPGAAAPFVPAASTAPAARNVLLLSVDTWRGDHLLATKGEVPLTPRLAHFALRATRFTDASSAGNATAAGVTGLLTGLFPRRAGVVRNVHRLQRGVPTLASMLQEHGFVTAAFVANPVLASEHGYAQGFERYELLSTTRRQTEGLADDLTQRAIAWIADQPGDGHFLLWLHYMDPHGPYEPPPAYDALFRAEDFEGPANVPLLPSGDQSGLGGIPSYQQVRYAGKRPPRDARVYAARYAAEVRFIDDAIATLLETMDERGWLDDTAVVLTSDHGEALSGEHGHFFSHGHGLTRDQTHVPLLLRCAVCGEGVTVDRPVSTIDIVPTLLELLGIPVPDYVDGTSLLRARPGPVVSQDGNSTAVRSGRWKLVLTPGQEPALFDLASEAAEAVDVAGQHAERVRSLRRELRAATRPPLARVVLKDALRPEQLDELRVLGYVE